MLKNDISMLLRVKKRSQRLVGTKGYEPRLVGHHGQALDLPSRGTSLQGIVDVNF